MTDSKNNSAFENPEEDIRLVSRGPYRTGALTQEALEKLFQEHGLKWDEEEPSNYEDVDVRLITRRNNDAKEG